MKVRNFNFMSVFIIASLLMLGSITTLAQDATIAPGETTSVTYTGSANVNVTLTMSEAQVVNIIVKGKDDFDPYFILYTAADRQLSYADDHETTLPDLSTTDAALQNIFLPIGEYRLEVSGFGTGEADVTVEQATSRIGFGVTESYEGEVAAGGRFEQDVDFVANEVVTVRVISEDTQVFDPRLSVLNSDSVLVAENDDYFTTSDSALDYLDSRIDLTTEVPGTHTLEVTSYNDTMTGTVRIYVTRYGVIATSSTQRQILTDTLVVGGSKNFDISGTAGEVIRVSVHAVTEGLDPRITLLDENGVTLAENDDHRSTRNDLNFLDSLINSYIVQEDGTISIEVASVSGEGNFEIYIDRIGTFTPIEGSAGLDPEAAS